MTHRNQLGFSRADPGHRKQALVGGAGEVSWVGGQGAREKQLGSAALPRTSRRALAPLWTLPLLLISLVNSGGERSAESHARIHRRKVL